MADIRSVILCDFAQVRDGLLFISSGGITRMGLPQFPGQISLHVGGQLELQATEIDVPHVITITLVSVQSAVEVWSATITVEGGSAQPGLFPGESMMVPFALALGPVPILEPGPYDLRVGLDGESTEMLTLYLLHNVPG